MSPFAKSAKTTDSKYLVEDMKYSGGIQRLLTILKYCESRQLRSLGGKPRAKDIILTAMGYNLNDNFSLFEFNKICREAIK